jgi:hypothetical protein
VMAAMSPGAALRMVMPIISPDNSKTPRV